MTSVKGLKIKDGVGFLTELTLVLTDLTLGYWELILNQYIIYTMKRPSSPEIDRADNLAVVLKACLQNPSLFITGQ